MSTPQPQAKKVEPARETVPIDHSNPLKPTHALSITHTKHKTIIVQDLSPSLSSLFTKDGLVIEEATKLIDATPAPPTLYTVKKENLLGTHLTVHDKEGKEVAEWNNPILTLHAGQVTIKFLGEQDQNTVTVKPVSHERLSEVCSLRSLAHVCYLSVSSLALIIVVVCVPIAALSVAQTNSIDHLFSSYDVLSEAETFCVREQL